MTCDAFNAEPGTVWRYQDAQDRDDVLFVVLPAYWNIVPEEHPGRVFRQYLDLADGRLQWFAERSHFNSEAVRYA